MSEIQRFTKEATEILSKAGKRTGLIVNLGERVSYIVPIYETFVINHAIINFDIIGEDIAKYLKRLLQQEGSLSGISWDMHLIRDIKKKLCYVAIDPDNELDRIQGEKGTYNFPDGNVIKVGEARYLASECIFKPNTIGKDIDPLDGAIVEVLSLCDVNFRRGLCNNILLYGTAVLPGLNERLTLEIKKKFQGDIKVKVYNIPEK